MNSNSKLAGLVLRLFLVIGVVTVLYFGKSVLLTLTVGGMLAILLDPIDERLRGWGWKPGLAITGAMLLLLLFFAGLFFTVGKQASRFAENWPEIESNLNEQIANLRSQLPTAAGKADTTQANNVPVAPSGSGNTTGSIMEQLPVDGGQVTGLLSTTLGILGDFLLVLVYVVLFLSQKERLREFALRAAPDDKRGLTHQTINEGAAVAQKYLKARLILILILSVLYTVGFMLAGLDYAVVIAVLAAVLSVIPYLGNIIGGLLALAIALAGGGGNEALIGVVITMSVAQLLESYILTPLIVGDEVEINPLTTIVAVIAFTVMWGAVGAIVAIPIVAILRIVLSHLEGTKDYAYLLGQE